MNPYEITHVVIDIDSCIDIDALTRVPGQLIYFTGIAPVLMITDPILGGIGWDANGAPCEYGPSYWLEEA